METILLRGDSKNNLKLLLKLAKQLNFSAKRLSAEETETMGIALSIEEGMKSGILNEKEKQDFITRTQILQVYPQMTQIFHK